MKSPDSRPRRAVASSRRPYQRGLLAGLLVIVLLGAALWYFISSAPSKSNKPTIKQSNNSQIASVTPAAARTNETSSTPATLVETNVVPPMKTYRDAQGILRWESGARAFDPARKRKPVFVPGGNERRIFKHFSERMIEHLLLAQPGEKRMSVANYDSPAFQRDFAAALEDEIVIGPDDTPSDRRRKEAMIEVKKELKERVAAGEKISDILKETNNELKRLAEYSGEIKKQVRDIIKNGKDNLSDQDLRDLVGAANQMLEKNGCNPINANQMMLMNIRANAKRMGLSQEEGQAMVQEYREKNKKKQGDN